MIAAFVHLRVDALAHFVPARADSALQPIEVSIGPVRDRRGHACLDRVVELLCVGFIGHRHLDPASVVPFERDIDGA